MWLGPGLPLPITVFPKSLRDVQEQACGLERRRAVSGFPRAPQCCEHGTGPRSCGRSFAWRAARLYRGVLTGFDEPAVVIPAMPAGAQAPARSRGLYPGGFPGSKVRSGLLVPLARFPFRLPESGSMARAPRAPDVSWRTPCRRRAHRGCALQKEQPGASGAVDRHRRVCPCRGNPGKRNPRSAVSTGNLVTAPSREAARSGSFWLRGPTMPRVGESRLLARCGRRKPLGTPGKPQEVKQRYRRVKSLVPEQPFCANAFCQLRRSGTARSLVEEMDYHDWQALRCSQTVPAASATCVGSFGKGGSSCH